MTRALEAVRRLSRSVGGFDLVLYRPFSNIRRSSPRVERGTHPGEWAMYASS